jgi:hypothetical protein
MRANGCLASALALGVVFSSAVFGQSIVEYGHGVAKAGVAGAASGTGLVGVFSSLKETSDDQDKRQSATVKTAAAEAARPGEPANAPMKMKTSSGVVVSGVSPSWITAYNEPVREPVRVKSVEWSNPSEEQAAVVRPETTAEAPAPEAAQETVEQPATPVETSPAADAHAEQGDAPGRVVPNATGYDWTGAHQDSAAATSIEPATDGEIAGIRIGSKIDDVIRTLGRPTFSFTGIVGKNYTEKYVFKKTDGGTITVLTWTGIVTSVLVS